VLTDIITVRLSKNGATRRVPMNSVTRAALVFGDLAHFRHQRSRCRVLWTCRETVRGVATRQSKTPASPSEAHVPIGGPAATRRRPLIK